MIRGGSWGSKAGVATITTTGIQPRTSSSTTTTRGEEGEWVSMTTTTNIDPHHLPPSYNTIPMKLPNGQIVSSLAFGIASSKNKKDTTTTTTNKDKGEDRQPQSQQQHSAGAASEHDNRKRKIKESEDMKRKWDIETHDVKSVFESMTQELATRSNNNGQRHHEPARAHHHYYTSRASALLASLEMDIHDVMASMKEAEEQVRKRLKIEADNASTNSMQEAEASNGAREGSQCQRSEKTSTAIIKIAQDTALIRELARIIQRRAVEMKEIRTSTIL